MVTYQTQAHAENYLEYVFKHYSNFSVGQRMWQHEQICIEPRSKRCTWVGSNGFWDLEQLVSGGYCEGHVIQGGSPNVCPHRGQINNRERGLGGTLKDREVKQKAK